MPGWSPSEQLCLHPHPLPLPPCWPSPAMSPVSQPCLQSSSPAWPLCVPGHSAGPRTSPWVPVPPTIADDRTDFTAARMTPVVLTCHSAGVPAPTVSWSKAGTQLGVRGSGYRVLPSGERASRRAQVVHGLESATQLRHPHPHPSLSPAPRWPVVPRGSWAGQCCLMTAAQSSRWPVLSHEGRCPFLGNYGLDLLGIKSSF